MNRETIPALHASQAVEDLLMDSKTSHSQQNWLLSYLDVFVLIVMLVITLLAMTDTVQESPKDSKKLLPNQQKYLKKFKSKRFENPINKKLTKPVKENKSPSNNHTNLIEDKQTLSIQSSEIIESVEIKKEKKSEKKPGLASNQSETSKQKTIAEVSDTKDNGEPINTWQNQLKNKLEKLQVNKFVTVEIGEGFAQIEIQDNILFESAKAELSIEGKDLLIDLALFLKQSEGLIFIEGHTDNKPISTKNFPSNWELGSARATSVLHFLTSKGLNSQRLRAVTYADTKPIEDNATEYGRQRNRRVNLLVKIPDD